MLAVTRAQPLLLCVLADAEPQAPVWEAMLDALDAVSPLVDDARPGLGYLDMRGMPGEARGWIVQARASLAPFGVACALGAASNKFTAYAAAIAGDGTICACGEEAAFLAPLPLDLLGVDERACERLRMLGIARLGDLARLSHGPFVRRFGGQAAQWHAAARGEDRTPFLPRAQRVVIEAAIFGEGRVEEEAQLFFALRLILARLCADLTRCGKRAGALELVLELEDGSENRIEIPVASPSAEERLLGDVVRAKLGSSTFPCAIAGLRMRALRLEEGGEEIGIFPAVDVDPRNVAVTLARLEAVTGEAPRRARVKPAHVLEHRFSYEPFTCSPQALSSRAQALPEALRSQLRLLTVREIEVHIEKGAPVRVGEKRVREVRGPWRIEEGWFDATGVTRDEYDVLLDDERLVRIYRQGERWYIRGTYD